MVCGFSRLVDPEETLEQCIHREVFEEVEIKVKNIRYFASQPMAVLTINADWFSHLSGLEGEIQINPSEIETAGWFDKDNLPPLSLSRLLIDFHCSQV